MLARPHGLHSPVALGRAPVHEPVSASGRDIHGFGQRESAIPSRGLHSHIQPLFPGCADAGRKAKEGGAFMMCAAAVLRSVSAMIFARAL
jgi:hypothetical protein